MGEESANPCSDTRGCRITLLSSVYFSSEGVVRGGVGWGGWAWRGVGLLHFVEYIFSEYPLSYFT